MTRLFSNRSVTSGLVFWIATATVCLGLVIEASADPIPVDNFSFEGAALASGGWSDCIDAVCGETDPEYWMDDPLNMNNAFAEVIDNFVADGTHHMGVQSGQVVLQDLGVSLMANSTYTLTVAVGNRSTAFTDANNDTIFGFMAGGENLGAQHVNASELEVSTFADYSFIYRTDAAPPTGSLGIYLGSAAANRAHFDDVRVDLSDLALGDVDGNGAVNNADFEIIRMNFLQSATSRTEGDLDGDGLVSFSDFREWKTASGGGAGSSFSIPEPSVLLLAVVATLGLLLQRSRGRVVCQLVLLAACLTFVSNADADPIPVNNHSFEEAVFPDSGGGTWTNCLDVACPGGTPDATDPDYWVDDPINNGNSFAEFIDSFASDGLNHLGVAAGNIVTQDLGVSLVASQAYQLTVSLGNREGQTGAGNESIFGFAVDGVEVARRTVDASMIPVGTFEDFTLSFPVGISPPVGPLGVFLGSDAGGRGHFDNVRAEFNPVVVGDVNGDGVANSLDFDVIRGNFLQSATSISDGDVNTDGLVDWVDFKTWKLNATVGSASTFNIPEPGTLFLATTIMVGAGGLLTRRRAAS